MVIKWSAILVSDRTGFQIAVWLKIFTKLDHYIYKRVLNTILLAIRTVIVVMSGYRMVFSYQIPV
jgi:hypothetical protein